MTPALSRSVDGGRAVTGWERGTADLVLVALLLGTLFRIVLGIPAAVAVTFGAAACSAPPAASASTRPWCSSPAGAGGPSRPASGWGRPWARLPARVSRSAHEHNERVRRTMADRLGRIGRRPGRPRYRAGADAQDPRHRGTGADRQRARPRPA